MNRSARWAGVGAAALALAVATPSFATAAAQKASTIPIGGTALFLTPPDTPFLDNFNPFSPSDQGTGLGVAEIYEPLIYFNSYTGQLSPKLAVRFAYGAGHKSILFFLRKGVEWSNGSPFTAADVAFTFDMILSHPAIDLNDLRAIISSVKTVNSYEVEVTLKQPSIADLYYIAGDTPIVPKAIWSTIKNPLTYTDPHPVTTGPWLVGSVNSTLFTLQRNPHYWDAPLPYLNSVQFPFYASNNTATLAMIKGQFTLAGSTIPNINQVLIAHDPAHYHWDNLTTGINALYTNDAVYPFSLASLRQAISDVINRPRLAELGEYGQETPVNLSGLPPTLLNKSWADPAVNKEYPVVYSVATAKAILKAAGFHWQSGNLVDPKGKLVSARILADAGATDWIEDAHLIAGDLSAIGVQASVQVTSAVPALLSTGNYDLALWWTFRGPGPYFDLNPTYSSAFSAPIGKPAGGDFERWDNTETNQLLAEFGTTFNVSQQHAIVDQLQMIFAKNLPIIPLLNFPAWYQYNDTSIVGMPTIKDPYAVYATPFDSQYLLAQLHKR